MIINIIIYFFTIKESNYKFHNLNVPYQYNNGSVILAHHDHKHHIAHAANLTGDFTDTVYSCKTITSGIPIYRKVSDIRRTKSQHLNVSRLIL